PLVGLAGSTDAPAIDVPAIDAPAAPLVARAAQTNKSTRSAKPVPGSRATRNTETQNVPPVITVAPSATKPNCDPPYTLDAAGNKRFKRECYQN
ncbi:MAG TPA: hypothetical protein VKP30_05905, partial [Polyangiaceae bacterium]|nr:hypothetical protein [Polyangiaceae bacterium]